VVLSRGALVAGGATERFRGGVVVAAGLAAFERGCFGAGRGGIGMSDTEGGAVALLGVGGVAALKRLSIACQSFSARWGSDASVADASSIASGLTL